MWLIVNKLQWEKPTLQLKLKKLSSSTWWWTSSAPMLSDQTSPRKGLQFLNPKTISTFSYQSFPPISTISQLVELFQLFLLILTNHCHFRMFNIVEFLTRIGLNLFTCKSSSLSSWPTKGFTTTRCQLFSNQNQSWDFQWVWRQLYLGWISSSLCSAPSRCPHSRWWPLPW